MTIAPLMAALDAIEAAVPASNEDPKQQLIAAKCRGLMMGYHARWQHVDFEVLSVEDLIEAGLYNPATERTSRTFTLAGKKDVTVRHEGQKVLVDHKTTSDDIEDPNSPYWRQLQIEAQPTHYMLIDWLRGEKIDYALWDVVRKPGIAPKEISAADYKATLATQAYCGYTLTAESLESLETGSKRETLEMYTARVADDCIRQRPTRYFQRRAVPRLDSQIAEHAQEVWDLAQEIMNARRQNRWFRNSKACMNYNTPCKFLGICSGHDTPDSGHWTQKNQVHNELPLLNGDGRGVLTFSRLASYQACRRKHMYEYELGIERIDEDEKESLFFGNVWHAAQEAWFKSQLINSGENNGNYNADLAPVNGIAAIGGSSSSLTV